MSGLLLFEKDSEKGKALYNLLSQENITVKYVSNALEAMKHMEERKESVYVLDIDEMVKDKNFSPDILGKIHEDRTNRVIFILSDPASKFSPLHYKQNIDDIILKPYRPEEVALRLFNTAKKALHEQFCGKEIDKINILFQIGSLPHGSLDIKFLTDNILEIIRTTFDCESAAIYMREESLHAQLINSVGPVSKADLEKLVNFTTKSVLQQNILMLFDDLHQEILWNKTDWEKADHLKNAVCVPLKDDKENIGVIELYNTPASLAQGTDSDQISFLKQVVREIEKILNISMQFSRVNKDLKFVMDELAILYEISNVLSSTLSVEEMLKLIVKNAIKSFNAQVASIMMVDKEKGELIIRCSEGLSQDIIRKSKVKIGEGVAGRVAQTGQPLLLVDVLGVDSVDLNNDIKSALSIPLKIKDEVIGVLNISKTSTYQFTETDLKLLYNLGNLAAQAIEKASLYSELKISLNEIKSSYINTLKAISNAIESKNPYTQGHVDRVAKYGLAIALEINPDILKDDMFRYALVLHDVGKWKIPDSILGKEESLTDEEKAIIRRHPEAGARILQPIKFLREAANIVRFHQERWDGTGYPDGLKGEEIPLVARIIAVADAFDAITTERPYRKAQSAEFAREEIAKSAGTQFDPMVVEAFLSALDKKVIP